MQAFTYTTFGQSLPLPEFFYDKVQHFGAGGSCGILGCFISALIAGTQSNRRIIVLAILTALTIGVLWEVIEHTWPALNGGTHSYTSADTIADIVLDCLGGLVAGFWYRIKNVTMLA